MDWIPIILFILTMVVVPWVLYATREEYGCDCQGREYRLAHKTSYNTYYTCTVCGTEDHIWIFQGGTMRINPRMYQWHIKRGVKKYLGIK